ncbi:hypothetical protein K3177_15025 [Qipengyuania sp. GH25]|uniref:Uncharacterized protein n=1 Tax=Qipengyuania pacifica TaxID=2860199 RepID=A0ABS7JKA4_9SPHN|nr:hypothetical protein [Qipengyuania aerophila]MBX7489819.1 hypothetical protein [Qipengyuania aerophila]
MSYGNRGVLTALAGLAALFTAFGSGAYLGFFPKPENEWNAASSTAEDTAQPPSPASHVGGGALSLARDLEPKALNQSYYDREDLKTQRIMAWWTRIMGVAAAIGIVLGGFSIWLIWRTWSATNVAAESSRKTLRSFIAKERAHLRIKNASFTYEGNQSEVGKNYNGFRLKLDNRGESACRVIEIGWQYSNIRHWLPKPEQLICKPVLVPSLSEEESPHLGVAEFPSSPCWLMGRVKYKTLEDETFVSYFSLRIELHVDPGYAPSEWRAVEDRLIAMPWDT